MKQNKIILVIQFIVAFVVIVVTSSPRLKAFENNINRQFINTIITNSSYNDINMEASSMIKNEDEYIVETEFDVIENGVSKLDLIFVVDCSNYMDGDGYLGNSKYSNIITDINTNTKMRMTEGWISKLNAAKESIGKYIDSNLMNNKEKDVRVGLVSYGNLNSISGSDANIDLMPTYKFDSVKAILETYTPSRNEIPLNEGILEANKLIEIMDNEEESSNEQEKRKKIVIIISGSDSFYNENIETLKESSDKLRENIEKVNGEIYISLDENLGNDKVIEISKAIIEGNNLEENLEFKSSISKNVNILSKEITAPSIKLNSPSYSSFLNYNNVIQEIVEDNSEIFNTLEIEDKFNFDFEYKEDSLIITKIDELYEEIVLENALTSNENSIEEIKLEDGNEMKIKLNYYDYNIGGKSKIKIKYTLKSSEIELTKNTDKAFIDSLFYDEVNGKEIDYMFKSIDSDYRRKYDRIYLETKYNGKIFDQKKDKYYLRYMNTA